MDKYRLSIYPPLSGNPQQQSVRTDINPDIVAMSWSSAIEPAGGFNGLEVSLRGLTLPAGAFLPQVVGLDGFYHVRVRCGLAVCWEGRIMKLTQTGTAITAFTCEGLGIAGMNDQVFRSGGGAMSGGLALSTVIAESAPLISIPDFSLWEDPGGSFTLDQFVGMKPAQVMAAVTKPGDGTFPVDFSVWENGAARLVSRIPPSLPDLPQYNVPLDNEVVIVRDYHAVISSASGTYTTPGVAGIKGTPSNVNGTPPTDNTPGTPTTLPSTGGTTVASNPFAADRYGVVRGTVLQLGNTPAANATQQVATALAQGAGPQNAITINVHADRPLRNAFGADVQPHLVRPGRWIQIGSSEVACILHTQFTAETEELAITAGFFPSDYFNLQQGVEDVSLSVIANTNPTSGVGNKP